MLKLLWLISFDKKIKPKTKKTDYKVDWKSKEFLDDRLKEMNEKNSTQIAANIKTLCIDLPVII